MTDATLERPVPGVGTMHDRRRQPRGDGPARLLRALLRDGLDPPALEAASALVLELEDAALRRRQNGEGR